MERSLSELLVFAGDEIGLCLDEGFYFGQIACAGGIVDGIAEGLGAGGENSQCEQEGGEAVRKLEAERVALKGGHFREISEGVVGFGPMVSSLRGVGKGVGDEKDCGGT